VVPEGYKRTFHMRFCTIRDGGVDDLSSSVVLGLQDLLFCEWCTPVMVEGITVGGCWMAAGWLRKVSGPSADADAEHSVDETRLMLRIRELDCA
jgi:hypothetical protein